MSMPSGSKKRRTGETENDNMNKSGHEDLFLQARKEMINNLKHPSRNVDEADVTLNKIRAIMTTNDEIWNRCKPATKVESKSRSSFVIDVEESSVEDGYDSTLQEGYDSKNDGEFRCCIFRHVHISKKATEEECTFQTVQEWKSFGQPPSLPQKLKDALSFEDSPVSYETFPTLICESYLQTCLVLHPEIVPYALVWLQDYLESIQVFFGEIESWLLSSATCREFLNQTFELVVPEVPERSKATYFPGTSISECWMIHSNARCGWCGESYSLHTGENKHKCPAGYNQPALGGYFECYPPQVLKTCKMIRGEFAHTFQIDKESEREKLKAFLNFSSVYNKEE